VRDERKVKMIQTDKVINYWASKFEEALVNGTVFKTLWLCLKTEFVLAYADGLIK